MKSVPGDLTAIPVASRNLAEVLAPFCLHDALRARSNAQHDVKAHLKGFLQGLIREAGQCGVGDAELSNTVKALLGSQGLTTQDYLRAITELNEEAWCSMHEREGELKYRRLLSLEEVATELGLEDTLEDEPDSKPTSAPVPLPWQHE